MSVELIVAVCAGIVSIIGAIGTVIVSIRNGQAIKADGEIKDKKLEEIHILVNSRLSEALTEIANLRTHVAMLTNSPLDLGKAQLAAIDAKPSAN